MSAARACAFAALVAAAAYWGTLKNGFAWDDHVHIEAASFVQDAHNARVLLTPGFWTGRTEVEGSARPLVLASLLADRALWGSQPEGYHLTNLLIHAACAAALAWLSWLLVGSAPVAALTGALFALHPVQTEAVCGIMFRADPLAALGVLLALAFLRLACARRSMSWAAASAAAFALGLLAKENAAVFPALALLMEFFFPTGDKAARARKAAAVLIAAVLLAYAAFRLPRGGYGGVLAAAPSAAPPAPSAAPAPAAQPRTQFDESAPEWKAAMRSPKVRLLTMSGVFGDYARLTLWPAGLQADRSAPALTRWFSPRAWLGFAALLLILLGARAARRELPAVGLGLCWFLAALVPVSGVVALPNLVAERYLYLALAGAALAAAAAVDAAARRTPRPRPALLAASAALLAPAAAATLDRVPAWRDDAALFGASPVTDSARLRYNRGELDQHDGRIDAAEKEYRRALELNPKSVEALVNLADIERVRGREPERLALLRRAVAAAPTSSIAYEDLGGALEAAGKKEDALAAYRKAAGLDPHRPSAQRRAAEGLARAGHFVGAINYAQAAAELEPKSAPARFALGRILQEAGRLGPAADAFRAAVKLDPKDALSWANLGVCLQQSGDAVGALAPMKLAVSLLPNDAEAWRNLGADLEVLNRLPEAVTAYETSVRLDPSSALAWHGYGVVLQRSGARAPADAAYLRALKIEPTKVESLANLAELRAAAGDFVTALPLIAHARDLRPGDAAVKAAYDDIARRAGARGGN